MCQLKPSYVLKPDSEPSLAQLQGVDLYPIDVLSA